MPKTILRTEPSRGALALQPSQPTSRLPGQRKLRCSLPGVEGRDGGGDGDTNGDCTDGVSAGLARFGEEGLEAAAAAGPAALHHVALPAEGHVAFQAAEVVQVPAPALRLDALLHEDQLRGGVGGKQAIL